MYILKNAWISIKRNKSRNILIGIIVFVIACFATVTLAINNTASDLISSYKDSYDKTLSITFNREKMMEDVDFSNRDNLDDAKEKFEQIDEFSKDDIEKFAKNEHIKSYYYTYEISLNGNTIEKVENSNDNNRPDGKFDDKKMNSSMDFSLNGYSSMSSMSEFIEGKYEMSEITSNAWDIAFDGNYIFINEELASYNNLNLNDKILLEDSNSNTYEFEIIGIYKENLDSNEISMFSNSVNTIITNSDALIKISDENQDIKGKIDATFIIDSYDNKEKIEKYFYEQGLNENYSVVTNEQDASLELSSVLNVKSFAKTFLVITLIIGCIVLFVLNMINIRERKYEIGVFRTIGMSKFKLTLQFMSELLMVSFVFLLIGAISGALMSKSVSNYLLSNEIENSNNNTNQIENNFGGNMFMDKDMKRNNGGEKRDFAKMNNMPVISAYKSIDAVVSIKVVFELLFIGIALVIVSSFAALISIQRFSPLTILKERS